MAVCFGLGSACFLIGPFPGYANLVGDSADGYPGLPGWGSKSAAAVLSRYGHLEDVPERAGQWDVPGLRNAAVLAKTLAEERELAVLFRRIATTEIDVPVGTVDEWEWKGPTDAFRRTLVSVLVMRATSSGGTGAPA